METILSTLLGSSVNLMQGEGNQLNTAAKALLTGVSGNLLVWHFVLTCKTIILTVNYDFYF